MAEREPLDPESQVVRMPDPVDGWTDAHEQREQAIRRRIRWTALRKAVTEAANAAPGNAGFVAYCGWPVEFQGREVVLILQIQKDIHDSHYHLTKTTHVCRRSTRESRIDRSLIDAVADGFLAATADVLTRENPGSGFSNVEDLDHVLLNAAKNLMYTPALAGGGDDIHGLFDVFVNLSTLKYEGKEGVGRIVIARPEHPHIDMDIVLSMSVPVRSFGAVRKLLQIASGQLCLLCDSERIYALGRIRPTYDMASEDIFTIRFMKQFIWDLLHGDRCLMHVRYGQPGMFAAGFPEEQFRSNLRRVFTALCPDRVDHLSALACSTAGQKHGSMLVISSEAADEAKRLDAQATRVEPFALTDALIPHVTSIDGAVLIDTEGTCHAIGVILDGMASPKCTPERGARYNSAVRYVYGRREKFGRMDAVAVVKSEDGMVSVFPQLRPQIRRSEKAGKLQSLRTVANTLPIDTRELWDLMTWFHDHAFYLDAHECNEVEHLYKEANAKQPPGLAYMSYGRELYPTPDMNDSYYLPE